MVTDKLLKVGAVTVLSITMLAGCGNSEDEPQMKQENDVPGEEQNDSNNDDSDDDESEENED